MQKTDLQRPFYVLSFLALVVAALFIGNLGGNSSDKRSMPSQNLVRHTPDLNRATKSKPDHNSKVSTEGDLIIASTPAIHDQLPISSTLEDTSIDGALKVSADGNLVLDIEVRDFFDYFLSTADDVGAEAAIAEIQRYAQTYLPDPARNQALVLLGNYLRYKQTEFQLQQTPITQAVLSDNDALQLLRSSFNQLKQRRESLFSAAQDIALFELEDSFAHYTLSSLELMADETTTDEQKRTQLAELEAQLPTGVSTSLVQTERGRERQQVIESLISTNQEDTQVYQKLIDQGVDKDQIESVIERRQQQRQFDTTYLRYKKEQMSLKQHNEPDSELYRARLDELRNRFFVYPEDKTQARLRDLSQD